MTVYSMCKDSFNPENIVFDRLRSNSKELFGRRLECTNALAPRPAQQQDIIRQYQEGYGEERTQKVILKCNSNSKLSSNTNQRLFIATTGSEQRYGRNS